MCLSYLVYFANLLCLLDSLRSFWCIKVCSCFIGKIWKNTKRKKFQGPNLHLFSYFQHGHTFQLAWFTKNRFNHLCSLDIVANRQLLHLWLNRFAERVFQRWFVTPTDIHLSSRHINTYLIYIIYISLSIWRESSSFGGNVQRKMLKRLYQKLSTERSDGLGCLHFKVRGHWNLLDTPHVVLWHFQRRRIDKNCKRAPSINPPKVDLPANAQIDRYEHFVYIFEYMYVYLYQFCSIPIG